MNDRCPKFTMKAVQPAALQTALMSNDASAVIRNVFGCGCAVGLRRSCAANNRAYAHAYEAVNAFIDCNFGSYLGYRMLVLTL